MYQVVAQIANKRTFRSVQIPIFYLDENTQGITSVQHAEKIALTLLNPFDDKDLNVVMLVIKLFELS